MSGLNWHKASQMLQRVFYAGVTRGEFMELRPEIDRYNRELMEHTLLFFALSGITVYIVNQATDHQAMACTDWVAIAFVVSMMVIYVLSRSLPKTSTSITLVLTCMLCVAVAVQSIDMGVVNSEYPAILFFILTVSFSVLFTSALGIMALTQLAALAGLCVASYLLQSTEVFNLNTAHAIAFIPLGWFMSWHASRVKIRSIVNRREAESQRDIDSLTRLPSRRRFDEVVQMTMADPSSPCIVGAIMVDIDHFKMYNDTYGHLSGDECLRQVASAIMKVSRDYDVFFARNGGEEFVGLLKEDQDVDLAEVAEAVRQGVSDMRIPHKAMKCGYVTVSVGYALVDPEVDGHDIRKSVAHADAALYDVKRRGRNGICAFDAKTTAAS